MEPPAIAAFIVGYLIGSLDFGVIVTRLAGIDIYSVGSGNPGASNVLRTVGKGAAAATLAGDVAKGVAAAMIGELWVGEAAGFAAGFAAVAGHCWPLWHGFKGGKGVATAVGAVLWLEPLLGLVLIVGWAAVVAVGRIASVASLLVALVLVPALAFFGHRGWSLGWAAAMAVLVVTRHHQNIRRLLAGRERPIRPG